jgi:nucleoside-diphosphate-sugar epimerase
VATVLITGGSGLIGRWVQAHWPATLEAVEVSHRDHDLADASAFVEVIRRLAPDAVLHLAWCASGSPGYRDSPENARWVEATTRAAHFCVDAGIHFTATGTVLDTSAGPDAYSAAKADLRERLGPQIRGGSITWLRPFYTFDPAARRPALVADCLAARAAGTAVSLRSPGSVHDFIHAADVGSAIAVVLEHRLDGILDIGSGRGRTVRELALACGAEVDAPEEPPAASEAVADTTPLRELGWSAGATEAFFAATPP